MPNAACSTQTSAMLGSWATLDDGGFQPAVLDAFLTVPFTLPFLPSLLMVSGQGRFRRGIAVTEALTSYGGASISRSQRDTRAP